MLLDKIETCDVFDNTLNDVLIFCYIYVCRNNAIVIPEEELGFV